MTDRAWNAFLRTEDKSFRLVAPDSTVVALFPTIRNTILLGHTRAMDIDTLLELMTSHTISIREWCLNIGKVIEAQLESRGHDPALVELY
ncbi:hypothetical protein V5O48_002168, partial [Marasmius crinis-equi]